MCRTPGDNEVDHYIGGILDMLAGLVLLFTFVLGMSFLLNCETTHCRKVLDLSSTRSLSHPEL